MRSLSERSEVGGKSAVSYRVRDACSENSTHRDTETGDTSACSLSLATHRREHRGVCVCERLRVGESVCVCVSRGQLQQRPNLSDIWTDVRRLEDDQHLNLKTRNTHTVRTGHTHQYTQYTQTVHTGEQSEAAVCGPAEFCTSWLLLNRFPSSQRRTAPPTEHFTLSITSP